MNNWQGLLKPASDLTVSVDGGLGIIGRQFFISRMKPYWIKCCSELDCIRSDEGPGTE